MSRRFLTIPCEGAELVATLDEADGKTGLLIVSGGNELRAGAWNGQARLAARIAAAGYPVLRFDRRGVGDSSGPNGGFRSAAPDIAAALAAFRAEVPGLTRVVAFGNCDAASALMLAQGKGCDGLVLSNPWTIENDGDEAAPPPAAVRAHYAGRLKDRGALLRLLTGKVSLKGLITSLAQALRPTPPPSTLAQEIAAGLARFKGEVTILLASRDRTAQVFEASWDKADPRLQRCEGASHSYVEPHAREWLEQRLLAALGD